MNRILITMCAAVLLSAQVNNAIAQTTVVNSQTNAQSNQTASGLPPEPTATIAIDQPFEDDVIKNVDEEDILDMDLEQLTQVDVLVPSFDVEITSVTRTGSTVGKSAASVFVITNDMIRRSGVTNVAEALQLAPGMMVSRIDSSRWAISSRGFSGEFANKLLVLIDGRSVYTPAFSGVHWSFQDTPLADVDRIEVIRGPGTSAWGSNAMNGVINIITRNSRETQGGMITSAAGTEVQSNNQFRYGGRFSDSTTYRIYGAHQERDEGYLNGRMSEDNGRIGRLGLRTDWFNENNDDQQLTFIGEIYQGNSGANLASVPIATFPFSDQFARDEPLHGGFAMLNWTEKLGEGDSRSIRTYYDHQYLDSAFSNLQLDIFDIDLQRIQPLGQQHQLTYGLGYRLMLDQFSPVLAASTFSPKHRDTHLVSAYLQDEYTIRPDQLFATAGIRIEQNSYTGFEYQPTVRLLRMFDPRNAIWTSLSRSVRIPSRAEEDLQLTLIDSSLPLPIQVQGNRGVQAEDLIALEFGYRTQPTDRLSWDVSLFFNEYTNLMVFDTFSGPVSFPPTLTTTFLNAADASTHGLELNGSYQINKDWSLAGWYMFNQWDIRNIPVNSPPPNAMGFAKHQARLTSAWNLGHNTELDFMLQFRDKIQDFNVPSNVDLGIRFGWRPTPDFELSVTGRNLLASHRFEYNTNRSYYLSTERQREVYGQATWRF